MLEETRTNITVRRGSVENLTLERRESTDTTLNPQNQNQRMPNGMERERHGETDSKSE